MRVLDFIRAHLLTLPGLAKFAIALAIIVGIPPLSRRLRLPAAVGLLLTGVVLGPHGVDLFGEHRPVAEFFAELGELLLMFFAGLEIDLTLFRKVKNRSIAFGLLTTTLPLLLGTGVALLFGYPAIPAVVIGSLLASHTLLGLPIVARLGVTRLEPMTITVGATVMSDTLSLIVFAICVSTFRTGFSPLSLGVQLLEIVIFVPLILFGLSRLGEWLLKKVEDSEDAYFIVMLAILAVAGLIAESINLPGIVGAFLAGLAVNAAAQDQPAKEKLEFFGNSFFIPIFFVATGFLIDPISFFHSVTGNFALVIAIVLALLVGKGIASEIAGRAFAYSPAARKTMWALTLPQVAATLAAALVAYDTFDRAGQRLLDVKMMNVVLVLMLTTAILGPILTEHFAPQMLPDVSDAPGRIAGTDHRSAG
jgi:Kef-type K+ transport system membrane component KefB